LLHETEAALRLIDGAPLEVRKALAQDTAYPSRFGRTQNLYDSLIKGRKATRVAVYPVKLPQDMILSVRMTENPIDFSIEFPGGKISPVSSPICQDQQHSS
jgi:hypothetical protein